MGLGGTAGASGGGNGGGAGGEGMTSGVMGGEEVPTVEEMAAEPAAVEMAWVARASSWAVGWAEC